MFARENRGHAEDAVVTRGDDAMSLERAHELDDVRVGESVLIAAREENAVGAAPRGPRDADANRRSHAFFPILVRQKRHARKRNIAHGADDHGGLRARRHGVRDARDDRNAVDAHELFGRAEPPRRARRKNDRDELLLHATCS